MKTRAQLTICMYVSLGWTTKTQKSNPPTPCQQNSPYQHCTLQWDGGLVDRVAWLGSIPWSTEDLCGPVELIEAVVLQWVLYYEQWGTLGVGGVVGEIRVWATKYIRTLHHQLVEKNVRKCRGESLTGPAPFLQKKKIFVLLAELSQNGAS